MVSFPEVPEGKARTAMENMKDVIPLIRKVPLFESFQEEEVLLFANKMERLSLPKGAVLYRAGEETDTFYVLLSGQARLEEPEKDGNTVAFLSRGDALGEMGLLTGEPRLYTAVVEATAEFCVLKKKDFDDILVRTPHLAVPLSRLLSRRLLEARHRTPVTGPTARLYTMLGPSLPADRTVLAVNLAAALAEQTRKNVLLLDLREGDLNGLCARALGLQPARLHESNLHQDDLLNPDMVHRLCARHPSGLEVMNLPPYLLEGRFSGILYAFLHALRRSHDFILLIPPSQGLCQKAAVEEADRVLTVESGNPPMENEEIRSLVTPDRRWQVRLETGAPAPLEPGGFRFPWKNAFREAAPALFPPDETPSQRAANRLARRMGGLSLGFAMGSGAAMAYGLIGFLKVMERHGIYPDMVSGTSMGALLGSFYALGKSVAEIEEIALSITKAKIWSLMDFSFPFPRQGILLGNEVLGFLKSVLGSTTFAELQLPLACVATDILNGEEVVLTHGNVAEAVRGSLSLPFFFKPYHLHGRYLVDGGLVNPVPTSAVAALGADILVTSNFTTKPSDKRRPGSRRRRNRLSLIKGPNILQVMLKTIDTMQWGIARSKQGPAHLVLEPDLSAYTWADFHRSSEIIRLGEDYLEPMIPKLKSFFPYFNTSGPHGPLRS